MSLDKSIVQGKERRKQYRGSKAFDRSCRNHGGCEWCLENRMYKNLKRLAAMKELENGMKEGGTTLLSYGVSDGR